MKPVAPSRGDRTSSLSYAGSDKTEEDKDQLEEGQKAARSESKDEEDEEEEGEIQQVDEEMKDAAEVMEAELQDTKVKVAVVHVLSRRGTWCLPRSIFSSKPR